MTVAPLTTRRSGGRRCRLALGLGSGWERADRFEHGEEVSLPRPAGREAKRPGAAFGSAGGGTKVMNADRCDLR